MRPMQSNRFFSTINRTIIILFVLVAPGYLLAFNEPPKAIDWQLSETKVVSRGTMGKLAEGSIRTGIRIEGKAVAKSPDAPFSEGVFSIVMTAFTPKEDMAGQKKGNWYLRGNWTITATDAAPKQRSTHSALAGVLSASLPYDPTVKQGNMAADVRLLQRGVGARAGRMANRGAFSGKSNLEGTLTTTVIPSLPTGMRAQTAKPDEAQ